MKKIKSVKLITIGMLFLGTLVSGGRIYALNEEIGTVNEAELNTITDNQDIVKESTNVNTTQRALDINLRNTIHQVNDETSLHTAVDNASAGDIIELTADIKDLTGAINIYQDITFRSEIGKNYTITAKYLTSYLFIYNGTVIWENVTLLGDSLYGGETIHIVEGNFIMNDGMIDSYYSTIYMGSGTVEMNRGTIGNGSNAVYIQENGTFTMNGGLVTGEITNRPAIYVNGGNLIINKVVNKKSEINGAGNGVYITNAGYFKMDDGIIKGSLAQPDANNGYATVYLDDGAFEMNDQMKK